MIHLSALTLTKDPENISKTEHSWVWFYLLPVPRAAFWIEAVSPGSILVWLVGRQSFAFLSPLHVLLKPCNTDHVLDPPHGECPEPVLLRGERRGLSQRANRPEKLMPYLHGKWCFRVSRFSVHVHDQRRDTTAWETGIQHILPDGVSGWNCGFLYTC